MRRTRRWIAAIGSLALLAGTMGSAAAQGTQSLENRADFIYQLDRALGIQPVYPANPDFSDVPPSSPYYGYIEAAFQDGITNGIAPGLFGPTLPITRAEAAKYLVIAFGAGSTAQSLTSTAFKDNGTIPSALVGYVAEAAKLGLMEGFPDGDFQPEASLTLAQEQDLLQHLTETLSSAAFKVAASGTDVASGEIVTLSATESTAQGASFAVPNVTYRVTGPGASESVISGSSFVATAAGAYTVEGTAGGASASVTIDVYGSPAGLKIEAPSSVVANGVSTSQVQVEIVDASGYVVQDATDSISLMTDTNAAAALLSGAGTTVVAGTKVTSSAAGGVADFTLKSGSVAGAVTTLSASDAAPGSFSATASVRDVAQVATSLGLSASSPYLPANASGETDAMSAEVLDQTGSPMIAGAYTVSFTASGPATFGGSETASGVYYGPSGTAATATLSDVQGVTGPVTVSADVSGLQPATATVTAVIAGAPAKLALSAAQTISAGGSTQYALTVEDSHGYPAAIGSAGAPMAIDLAISDLTAALNGTAGSAVLQFTGQSSETFMVSATLAGSDTITATDPSGLLGVAASSLTVDAGGLANIEITPAACEYTTVCAFSVPTSHPEWTETVQLTDAYGNPVALGGVPVDFGLRPAANIGSASIDGQAVTTQTASSAIVPVATNAAGQAVATIQAAPYDGDQYTATAWLPGYPGLPAYMSSGGIYGMGGPYLQGASVTILQNAAIGSPQVVYQSHGGQTVSTLAADGSPYTGTIALADGYGNAALESGNRGAPDSVLVTESGTGSAALSSGTYGTVESLGNGSYLVTTALVPGALSGKSDYGAAFDLTGGTAGSVTFSYQDVSVLGAAPLESTVSVTTGTSVAGIGFSSGGTAITETAPLTLAPGDGATITASADDSGGNAIIATSVLAANLAVTGGTGSFRATSTGPNEASPFVEIPAGQNSQGFYFVNTGSASENVWFTGDVLADVITSPAPVVDLQPNHQDTLTWMITAGGHPIAGAAAQFSTTAQTGPAGSISSTFGVTNGAGQVSVTFMTPSGWQPGDTSVVSLMAPGTAAPASTVQILAAQPKTILAPAQSTYAAGSTTPLVFTVLGSAGSAMPAGFPIDLTANQASGTGTFGIAASPGGPGSSALTLYTQAGGVVDVYLTDSAAGDTGTVTATAAGFPTVTTTTGVVQIVAGAAYSINVMWTPNTSGDMTAGTTNFTIAVQDKYGNGVTGATVDLATACDPTGTHACLSTLPAGTTAVTGTGAQAGLANYSYTQTTADEEGYLVATLSGSTLTAQSTLVVVQAGPVTQIVAPLGTYTTGTFLGGQTYANVTFYNVKFEDKYGNIVYPVPNLPTTLPGNNDLNLIYNSGGTYDDYGYSPSTNSTAGTYAIEFSVSTGMPTFSGARLTYSGTAGSASATVGW